MNHLGPNEIITKKHDSAHPQACEGISMSVLFCARTLRRAGMSAKIAESIMAYRCGVSVPVEGCAVPSRYAVTKGYGL